MEQSPLIPSGSPNIPSPNDLVQNLQEQSRSWFDSKWFKYLLIILILAILGFNLFAYLGDATDKVKSVFAPIVRPIAAVLGDTIGDTAKQTVSVSAEGASAAIKKTADVATDGISAIQGVLHDPTSNPPPQPSATVNAPNANDTPAVDRARRAESQLPVNRNGPEPDESGSIVQSGRSGSQFCYIGEEKGVRSCVAVSAGDRCMSGQIFPTKDVCVNPSLRV